MKKLSLGVSVAIVSILMASTVLAANEKSEAAIIVSSGTNINVILNNTGAKKDVKAQAASMTTYVKPLIVNVKGIKLNQEYALNNFIVYGTKGTKTLTQLARYQLIVTYQKQYKKLPLTSADWVNLLKINSNKSSAKNTACNNYQCLIAAAAKCQPISANVSFAGTPSLFDPITQSGQTAYEIQKASSTSSCILKVSSSINAFTISDSDRKKALALGATDAQITAQLKGMNDSLKSTTVAPLVCPGSPSIIVSYLTDAENGNSKSEGSSEAVTYTTSSGQKLVCNAILPPGQPANTATIVKDTDCTAKKGVTRVVASDGTACHNNETDLGTVEGSFKMNGKYPQCCVSK